VSSAVPSNPLDLKAKQAGLPPQPPAKLCRAPPDRQSHGGAAAEHRRGEEGTGGLTQGFRRPGPQTGVSVRRTCLTNAPGPPRPLSGPWRSQSAILFRASAGDQRWHHGITVVDAQRTGSMHSRRAAAIADTRTALIRVRGRQDQKSIRLCDWWVVSAPRGAAGFGVHHGIRHANAPPC
jgi:hypothetical protein